MENAMDHQETIDMLANAGFTPSEIDLLQRLQQDYGENRHHHMSATYQRLDFMRWLVETGKLSEHSA
jgi:hypothetical protein